MSLDKSVALNCPKCDHVQSVTVWTSLNAQVSPEAKKDFFEGKINVFHCDSCGHTASLDTDFMYHDMQLQFCVQYYPTDIFQAEEIWKEYHPDGSLNLNLFGGVTPSEEMQAQTQYMLHPHVVFSMKEAFLYVLFRERLAHFHASKS